MTEQLTINTDPESVTYTGVLASISGTPYTAKEWTNFKRRAKRNGYSLPKQVLVDYIKAAMKESPLIKRRRKVDFVLAVKIEPCGSEVSYRTFDDIPDHDVPCPCGDPKHWIIRYQNDLPTKDS